MPIRRYDAPCHRTKAPKTRVLPDAEGQTVRLNRPAENALRARFRTPPPSRTETYRSAQTALATRGCIEHEANLFTINELMSAKPTICRWRGPALRPQEPMHRRRVRFRSPKAKASSFVYLNLMPNGQASGFCRQAEPSRPVQRKQLWPPGTDPDPTPTFSQPTINGQPPARTSIGGREDKEVIPY